MYLRIAITAAAALLPILSQAQTTTKFNISTVAGNGTFGYSGDAAAATSAQLNAPCGVAVDSSGNLYISDHLNSRVRMVGADGNISTVAGKGTAGYTGDNGVATSAELNHPCGLAIDGSGNLYIADTANHVIRKRASGGTITTVAGTAASGYSGDGDTATKAELNSPMAVALDSAGNLYIADTGNQRIRKLGTDGKITLVAGNGFTGSVGDGGLATDALFDSPQAVAVDASGNIYIADFLNMVVRKVGTDGKISRFAGNGDRGYVQDGVDATSTPLNYPRGLLTDAAGNVYISDGFNNRVRVVTNDGKINTVAGNGVFGSYGDGGAATDAAINSPIGLAKNSAGAIFVAESESSRVRKLTPNFSGVASIAPGGVIGASGYGAYTATAPGSWIEIYGTNLAGTTRDWSAADFKNGIAPTSLGGTSVTIGGQPAFVSYVSPVQVNALVPSNVATGLQQVTVTTAWGTSASQTVMVNAIQPGFQMAQQKIGGKSYAAALFADGKTRVLPAGSVADVVSRPARAGDIVVLYGVGFGAVTPAVDAGQLAAQATTLVSPVRVFFGGQEAIVSYAGLAPGTAGLYQFNVVVPPGISGDAVALTFTQNGAANPPVLYTAVAN